MSVVQNYGQFIYASFRRLSLNFLLSFLYYFEQDYGIYKNISKYTFLKHNYNVLRIFIPGQNITIIFYY